jgi:hypothetical protein
MIKTTGAEFKRFYDDPSVWGWNGWCEDIELNVNNSIIIDQEIDSLADSDNIQILNGVIYFDDESDASLETTFKKWRKRQITTILMVEVPKEKAEALKIEIRNLGGRII